MSDINIYSPPSLEFFFFEKNWVGSGSTCNNKVKVYTYT